MMNLCFRIMLATFFTIPADSRQVATRNWELSGSLFNKGLDNGDPKTKYMQYGSHTRIFLIATAAVIVILRRYCVPMDHSHPELDLKYFDDLCPDKNGMSSTRHEFVVIFNLSNPSPCHSSIHQVRPIPA